MATIPVPKIPGQIPATPVAPAVAGTKATTPAGTPIPAVAGARTATPTGAPTPAVAAPLAGGSSMKTTTTKTTTSKLPAVKAYTERNEDVGKLVTGLMAQKSPLMKQAETAGLQLGNARGLLNSSFSVGAAQAEGYKVAVPLATSQLNVNAARNLANQNYLEQRSLTQQQTNSTEGIAAADRAAQAERLAATIKSEEKRLGRQITSTEKIALEDRLSTEARLNKTIKSEEARVDKQIKSEEKRLGRQLTSQERTAAKDRAAQDSRLDKELKSADKRSDRETRAADRRQAREIKANQTEKKLDRNMQQKLEDMRLDSNDRAGAATMLSNAQQLYSDTINRINENKDLSSEARQAQVTAASNLLSKRIEATQDLYAVKLEWKGPGSPAAKAETKKAEEKAEKDKKDKDKKKPKPAPTPTPSPNPPVPYYPRGNNSGR